MRVLGLTGSIGMGKTTAATMLRHLGCGVHDADAAVHRVMAPGGAAVGPVEAAFPGVIGSNGAVDRPALGHHVFGNPKALQILEGILHPLVAAERERFLTEQNWMGRRFAVLDIPLLFETGGDAQCDWVMVVTAPAIIQTQRVLSRPGMNHERLMHILARQMPDAEKRKRADSVIWTSLGKSVALQQLKNALTLALDQK